MSKRYFVYSVFILAFCVSLPAVAFAHQPRIVESNDPVIIDEPEVSKAYYGRLTGEPHTFVINAPEPFSFYMNVLVPDVEGAKADVSAALIDPRDPEEPLVLISGGTATWEPYFEEFARDMYLKGPEAREELPGGVYEIKVWSSNNDSAYTLAVGGTESFPLKEIVNAYVTIPKIKSEFFNQPAYTAFFTPVLGIPLLGIVVIILIVFLVMYWRRRSRILR